MRLMPIVFPSHRIAVLLSALATFGCNNQDEAQAKPDASAGAPVAKRPPPAAGTTGPTPSAATGTGDSVDTEDDDDGWETPTDGSPEATEAPVAEPPQGAFAGPCKIRWTTGAVLKFNYREGGGKVRIDEDGDGKFETCGTFESADGKTTQVKIDQGCNKSVDLELAPQHDDKANIATATYAESKGGSKTSREITLVTMPSFTGLEPGFVLQTPRKKARLQVRGGLVRVATVKTPDEGPPVKVTFGYDDKGRVKRVKEDQGIDGSTDRRFDYRYDALGNVTGMNVTIGSGDKPTKARASISYGCWEKSSSSTNK